MILSNTAPPTQRKQMEELFPNVNASIKFPRLHRLALGLESGGFETEAERKGFDINIQDSVGRTALLWACLRGDARSAQWLLTRGADPNIADRDIGRTPLMAACSCVSLACIKMLLEYGADINARNEFDLDALIYVCDEDRNPQPITEIIEAANLLIECGIDLHPRGANGTWCLARAARTQIIELMELIISRGVNVDYQNQFRQTTLLRSIAWSASRSAEYLLNCGAAYTGDVATDVDGRTILHYAALNPSMEMIQVLLDASLARLDPDVTDNAGLTAEDYMNKAEGLVDGFVPAFLHLLSDVRIRFQAQERAASNSSGWIDQDDTDECEFVDALQWPTTAIPEAVFASP